MASLVSVHHVFVFVVFLLSHPGAARAPYGSPQTRGATAVASSAGRARATEARANRALRIINIYVDISHIYQARATEARANRAYEKNLHLCLTEIAQNQPKTHILLYQKMTQGKTCSCFSTIFHRKISSPPKRKKLFFLTEVSFFHLFFAILRFIKISRSKRLRVAILITSSS